MKTDQPDNIGVHISHCCPVHGCKYGNGDCPVVNKTHEPEYACEDCDSTRHEWSCSNTKKQLDVLAQHFVSKHVYTTIKTAWMKDHGGCYEYNPTTFPENEFEKVMIKTPILIPTLDGKEIAETIMHEVQAMKCRKTGEIFLDGNTLAELDRIKAHHICNKSI